jgi:hypothetical protein
MAHRNKDTVDSTGTSLKRYLSEPLSACISREEVAQFITQIIGYASVRVCKIELASGRSLRLFIVEIANSVQGELKLCTRAFKFGSNLIRFYPAVNAALNILLQPTLKLEIKFEPQEDQQYLRDLLCHLQKIGHYQINSIKSLKEGCSLMLQVEPNFTLASFVDGNENQSFSFKGVLLQALYEDEAVKLESSILDRDLRNMLNLESANQGEISISQNSNPLINTYVSSSELCVLSQAIAKRLVIEDTATPNPKPSPIQHLRSGILHNSFQHKFDVNDVDELSDIEEEQLTSESSLGIVLDSKSQALLTNFQQRVGLENTNRKFKPKRDLVSKKLLKLPAEQRLAQEKFRRIITPEIPDYQNLTESKDKRWLHLNNLKQRVQTSTKPAGSSLLEQIFPYNQEAPLYSGIVRAVLEEQCRKLIEIKDKLRLEKHLKKKVRKQKQWSKLINDQQMCFTNPNYNSNEENENFGSEIADSDYSPDVWVDNSAKWEWEQQVAYPAQSDCTKNDQYQASRKPIVTNPVQYNTPNMGRIYGERPRTASHHISRPTPSRVSGPDHLDQLHYNCIGRHSECSGVVSDQQIDCLSFHSRTHVARDDYSAYQQDFATNYHAIDEPSIFRNNFRQTGPMSCSHNYEEQPYNTMPMQSWDAEFASNNCAPASRWDANPEAFRHQRHHFVPGSLVLPKHPAWNAQGFYPN